VSVEVVIPFRGGCPHRERALNHVLPLYATQPWDVRIATGGEPWVKASAVNPAVESSAADILILADADVWTAGLAEAVGAVERGAAWAVPHGHVHRLSEGGTTAVYRGASWQGQPLAERSRHGMVGGGIVVARREVLREVPMDPRFVGWGQEDQSFGLALHCLAGACWRGTAPLIHFYHPPQERLDRTWGSLEGTRLRDRYHAARANPDAMRALLAEI
jgi:hypothetical protein